MGCGSGACSATRLGRPACAACSEESAADAYRARMNAAFNPWRNAGETLPSLDPYGIGNALQSTDAQNVAYGGDKTGSSGGTTDATTAAGLGLLGSAIEQGAAIARTQIGADLERDRLRTQAEIARTNAEYGYATQGTQRQSTSATSDAGVTNANTASSGSNVAMLAALGLAAGFLSGVIKLPRGR